MTEPEATVERRRSRLIVNPRFQYRLLRLAVAIWAVNTTFVIGFICYLYGRPFGFERFLGGPPVRILPSPPPQLLLLAGLAGTACLLLAVVGTLRASHRIAGPAYRLKRSMHRVTAGDLDFVITLRRNDSFNDVCDSFNEMLDSLGARVRRDIEILRTVEATLPENSAERGQLESLRLAKELELGDGTVDDRNAPVVVAEPSLSFVPASPLS